MTLYKKKMYFKNVKLRCEVFFFRFSVKMLSNDRAKLETKLE